MPFLTVSSSLTCEVSGLAIKSRLTTCKSAMWTRDRDVKREHVKHTGGKIIHRKGTKLVMVLMEKWNHCLNSCYWELIHCKYCGIFPKHVRCITTHNVHSSPSPDRGLALGCPCPCSQSWSLSQFCWCLWAAGADPSPTTSPHRTRTDLTLTSSVQKRYIWIPLHFFLK